VNAPEAPRYLIRDETFIRRLEAMGIRVDRVLRGRLSKMATRDMPLPGGPANVPETTGAADVSDAAAREGLVALPAVPRPQQAWVPS